MKINIEQKSKLTLNVNDQIHSSVIVCSHERSGTHFLMNSIASNSPYISKPWLNFDLSPFGNEINFYSPNSVKTNLEKLSEYKINDKSYQLTNIIKSHHNADFFQSSFNLPKIKFIYIYREPVATMMSLWDFLQKWEWHEGIKTDTAYNFAISAPQGQMMRYQYKSHENHFHRWAYHVSGWLENARKYNSILLINYDDLKSNYSCEVEKILEFLNLEPQAKDIVKPSRENYIQGAQKQRSESDRTKLEIYVNNELNSYPILKELFVK